MLSIKQTAVKKYILSKDFLYNHMPESSWVMPLQKAKT